MVKRSDHRLRTYQCTVAYRDTALILKLTACVDKHIFAELSIFAAIGVERREHIRAFRERSACQLFHQHADLLGRMVGVVQLGGYLHRLVAEIGHIQMRLAFCDDLGTAVHYFDKLACVHCYPSFLFILYGTNLKIANTYTK